LADWKYKKTKEKNNEKIRVFANPFVDVPLNHWGYDSVQALAAKGIIVGYPDGTFGGGKSLTRYEFAEATAREISY
jgi:hypothetical protein